ncbi:semaphorin-5B isoform X1 [Trematomus bernacchii]|uniref:semaphorin-5B isoform X1 n=1 Tax=Trematomus bernacchii TaxID=40690 RepID=UPI00146A6055|nr:semaphorin-5B isoform X1 [Trematomus bernacchii]XP_034003030.1 semaphorin-5B isoform X1 [Trematomus bernacchii]XP_034003031.1 semaphorin-5B isoform X1 [Trematomus bernacchii]XP_034003032.1 semaphorin-5B isoform X1 [Trematomus bernacchii]
MTTTSQDPAPSLMAALLLFLLLLLPTVSMQTPVDPTTPSLFDPLTQPECTKKEHPKVSIQALSPWISSFSRPGVRDFSQLTLDLTRNELIVGARNFLFRLDLSNMSLIQATEWAPDEDTRRSCQSKGKTEIECQNYIRVLLVNKTEVMSCGTNAFQPQCITREVGNLSSVLERVNGVARCPYDPRHNSTAVVTESGELYAATVIDFSGRDPVIYRSLGGMPPLRTAQYNSKWLNEPHFISAYDIGLFTFFFLRENAVEHDCGKTVYSRVARVCKNDIGGRFLLEDTWTTFMKARLNCSRSGEIPFYYNELQSTFYLPEQDLIYGIFTTNVNSIAASAVCAFNLSAISQAFNGPFRSQENPRSTWLPTANPIHNFQCGTINDEGPNEGLTERSLQDAQRLYLMNDVVQPESVDPLVMQDDVRFSNLVVDIVQGMDTLYHVMYISTEYGTILKALATPNKNLQGCYLEEMELLPVGVREPILSLQILHSDRSLFVGLNNRVLKIPLERCSTYKTETLCLEARDPYCGWDFRQRRCTTLEESSNMSQWKQNITVCPLRNQTTNGGFGPWAPWQPCNNDDGVDGVSSCLCRSRSCDSPGPRCGGKNCEGSTIEVSNCSRNGGWTPWSSWGQCSTTCGTGFELRQRSCNNPSPRHGGRVCVGPSRDERFCNEGVSCPQPIFWSPWGSWTKCSTECGGGVHSRVRSCENGNSCPGCALEYKACNLEACPEVKRNTPWTPWMPVNVTQGGARQEQRIRYMCRAHLSDPHELQIGRRKVETRFCPNDGTAACETDTLVEELLKTPVVRVAGAGWSSWETWSSCSQSCAKGYRTRRRSCSGPEGKSAPVACRGSPVEYQDCNVQACPVKGAWSCWSSWSQCSVGCGGGHYQRTRSCNNPAPANGGEICLGLHTEEALCNTHTCDDGCVLRREQMEQSEQPDGEQLTDRKGGWMAWSLWSACDDSGLQMRSRVCGAQGSLPCLGNSTQRRDCNEIPVILPASGFDKDQHCGAFTSIHLIATGVSCFLGAGLLSFLIYVYCQRFHKPSQESAVIHPTTPNHLNYKGNTTPKNEKYTPMEFKTLNKNNLLPDERSNFFPTPLQQTNVYTTTYYPTALGKFDYQPNSSPSPCRTYNQNNNS